MANDSPLLCECSLICALSLFLFIKNWIAHFAHYPIFRSVNTFQRACFCRFVYYTNQPSTLHFTHCLSTQHFLTTTRNKNVCSIDSIFLAGEKKKFCGCLIADLSSRLSQSSRTTCGRRNFFFVAFYLNWLPHQRWHADGTMWGTQFCTDLHLQCMVYVCCGEVTFLTQLIWNERMKLYF